MIGHIVARAATELTKIKRSSDTKDVTTEIIWTFELGVANGIAVHVYVVLGFLQRGQFNQ